MGALFNNVCYPTQEIARQNVCSQFDSKNSSGTNLYTNECSSTEFTVANMSICQRTNGGTCSTISQPWPVTPACTHDGGVSLSYDYFLVALTLLCTVWGGKKLIQLFDTSHAES